MNNVKSTPEGNYLPVDKTFNTRAIHEANDAEQWRSMAVVPPISLSTTFKQTAPAQFAQFEYSRSGNPTRDVLERCFASLEHARFGLAFSSGLAATASVFDTLSSGDHVVAMDDLYGGTNRFIRRVAAQRGIETTFVDASRAELVEQAITPRTKLVWIETPTNPTMKLVDIKAVAAVTSGRCGVSLLVDNTFMSPYLQQPLTLGADIVLHSATKYINGHSDVVMGLVATNDDGLHQQLRFIQNAAGAVPSPFDCYLVHRSLKTLALRMQQHGISSVLVAEFLQSHPAVERVLHPGLKSHPQHEISLRQTTGPSGIFSFYIRGGLSASESFLKSLKIATLAESLGGYETLAELPCQMTHSSVCAEERQRLGISDNLVRVSVGLEDVDDIIEDFRNALNNLQ